MTKLLLTLVELTSLYLLSTTYFAGGINVFSGTGEHSEVFRTKEAQKKLTLKLNYINFSM